MALVMSAICVRCFEAFMCLAKYAIGCGTSSHRKWFLKSCARKTDLPCDRRCQNGSLDSDAVGSYVALHHSHMGTQRRSGFFVFVFAVAAWRLYSLVTAQPSDVKLKLARFGTKRRNNACHSIVPLADSALAIGQQGQGLYLGTFDPRPDAGALGHSRYGATP